MRTKILLLVFLSLIIIKSKAELTYLIGKVPNYNSLDQQIYMSKSVSVSFYNLIWVEEIESGLIQKNGDFKVIFNLPFAQEVYIKSGTGDYIASLVNPGDTIQLNLEYQLSNQKRNNIPSPFYKPIFENAFLNTYKTKQDKFFNFYYKWIIEKRIRDQIMSENKGINNQLAAIGPKLDSYFLNNEVDSDLYKWGINDLFYSILTQSIDNGDSINLKNLDYPAPKAIRSRQFYLALNRIENRINGEFYNNCSVILRRKMFDAVLSNSFIVLSTNENILLNAVISGTRLSESDSLLMINLSSKLTKSKKLIEYNDSLTFNLKAKYLSSHLPQYLSDCLIAQTISEKISDKLDYNYIVDKSMKDYVIQKREKTKKSNSKIEDFIFPENSIITGLIEKNKGKAMYVDIWATWCGACRSEFPNYPSLIEHSGDNIKFVFLCVQSPEKTYLKVINDLKFNAEHYFLSAKQNEEISVNYKITGLPHYLYITSEGKVINNTFGPSNQKKLFELFDKD